MTVPFILASLALILANASSGSAFVPHYSPAGRHLAPTSASSAIQHPSVAAAATGTALFSIADEVTAEMKVAMRAKDKVTLGTVRLIRAAFANAAIECKTGGEALSDDQARTALRKMAKMRQESIDMFSEGGAEDRAEAERAELAVIERWLPQLADEDTTRAWAKEAIEATGVSDMSKMGIVMGALMKSHKADLDGKLAQKMVREELSK